MKVLAVFLLLAFPALTIFAAETNVPASPEVDATLQPYLDDFKMAGIIAVIADKDGNILYKNMLGRADVENNRPMVENNMFWVASMSKMFAGASIMMLVDEGKLSLDDPVTKYIPRLGNWMVVEEKDEDHLLLKPPVRPVTIRHLLSHTSGLAGSSEVQQATGSDGTPLAVRSLASVTGPLQSQPGEKYAYGNQGMNIAARIVEIVSRKPYEKFLQERFFDPLGMKDTTFWPNEDQVARLAVPYGPNRDKTGFSRGDVGFLAKPYWDRTKRYPEAGGGLFSTTNDMLRYGLMLVNEGELDGRRYLSKDAIAVLRKEQTGETKVNYSLGYHLRNGMFGHDGAYGTDLSVNPDTGIVAVFMVQCTGGAQWEARDRFLKTANEEYKKVKGKMKCEIRKLSPFTLHIPQPFRVSRARSLFPCASLVTFRVLGSYSSFFPWHISDTEPRLKVSFGSLQNSNEPGPFPFPRQPSIHTCSQSSVLIVGAELTSANSAARGPTIFGFSRKNPQTIAPLSPRNIIPSIGRSSCS